MTLDVSVTVSVLVRVSIRITVKIRYSAAVSVIVRVRVSVRVMVRARVRVSVRAEWATKVSPKHLIAAHVWVYFKLKYTGYIFDDIFCQIRFVRYNLSSIFCPVYFVRYVLSGYILPGIFCPCIFLAPRLITFSRMVNFVGSLPYIFCYNVKHRIVHKLVNHNFDKKDIVHKISKTTRLWDSHTTGR